MKDSLKVLNQERAEAKKKPLAEENFLQNLNSSLAEFDSTIEVEPDHSQPILFVIGLPRSGTTFCTQVVQQAFELGYINNLMARFWLAPLTGIKLSQQILGDTSFGSISSDYATTSGLDGLHEFGYFWRYWLKKESADDFIHYQKKEPQINWNALADVLGKIRSAIGKPMVMKNNFGGFHINRILKHIPNSYFIHILRNPIDVAISIENARSIYYDDPKTWWSTIPPNYEELKNLELRDQIISQIKALMELYSDQITENDRTIAIEYEELASNPTQTLNSLQEKLGISLPILKNIEPFKVRDYKGDERFNIYSSLL